MRFCSLMSMKALIQPVCWPWALISGASKINTGKRVPSLRMKMLSWPSRGGGALPDRRLSRRRA